MTPLMPISQEWWTAAELAEAALPDLPASARRINILATECGWRECAGRARRRAGKGGGWEYHYSLLPSRAQLRLLSMELGAPGVSPDETATRGGLAVPYVLDSQGLLAGAFGVRNAPHAYFFDGGGALRYSGALDDSPASADRVRVPYLAQAMDQSVASLPIEVQQTQAIGCTIERAGE